MDTNDACYYHSNVKPFKFLELKNKTANNVRKGELTGKKSFDSPCKKKKKKRVQILFFFLPEMIPN